MASSQSTLYFSRYGMFLAIAGGILHEFASLYRLRKSVLSKNFMHILAIRSMDDHLFARFIWARRLKYALVWAPVPPLAGQ
jgi:hypothetical protein